MIPVAAYIALAAAAAGAYAGWQVEHWRLGGQIADIKAKAAEQTEAHRATERQWADHVIKMGDDSNAEAEKLRAAAARAGAAARSLHDAAARRAAEAPAAAGAGQAATPAAVVLADVFRRADGRAGELAAALDASRAAGLACERFDALTR